MTKYNQAEKENKRPLYASKYNKETIEKLYEKILEKFVVEKRYRDCGFSEKKMAETLGISARYVSIAINTKYKDNYSQLLNEFRIREAMSLLRNCHVKKMTMQDIARSVGFASRQAFHCAFQRHTGMTPKEYRRKCEDDLQGKQEEERQYTAKDRTED